MQGVAAWTRLSLWQATRQSLLPRHELRGSSSFHPPLVSACLIHLLELRVNSWGFLVHHITIPHILLGVGARLSSFASISPSSRR